jgi:hypothetical protein
MSVLLGVGSMPYTGIRRKKPPSPADKSTERRSVRSSPRLFAFQGARSSTTRGSCVPDLIGHVAMQQSTSESNSHRHMSLPIAGIRKSRLVRADDSRSRRATSDPKRPSKRWTLSGGVGATVAGRERRKRKWPAFDHDEILQLNRYQRSLYSSVDPCHFVAEVIWARCVRCVPTLVFGLQEDLP